MFTKQEKTGPLVSQQAKSTSYQATLQLRMHRNAWGYVFVAPWVLLYLAFGILPLILSFALTFFNYSFINPGARTFVGYGNWERVLNDDLFWRSVVNIAYNQIIFIFLKNGLGLFTAILLTQIKWGARFFRTVYFIPVLTSVVVLMQVGDYLIGTGGPIQEALMQHGLLDKPVFWRFDIWLTMPIIAVINSWKWFGLSAIILLAGLTTIDPQLKEAAAIDGANGRQIFVHITFPMLRPQLLFLGVVDVISGLQMFAEIFTNRFDVYGGVKHQALTPVLYIYAQAFDRSNMGYASTLGLMLAGLIAIVTFLQFKLFAREGGVG